MRDQNAQQLLAKVMDWKDEDTVSSYVPKLQLLADFKYDYYQRFGPGRRFIESLALWLNQFETVDRTAALDLITDQLIYISDVEFSHLVQMAYPDLILQERIRLVAAEKNIPDYHVGKITNDSRFKELRLKSLYLGLSDGARTSELRRASDGEISNEQIWHTYEFGIEKAKGMVEELDYNLKKEQFPSNNPRFNLVWLIDDFSASGYTYIRFDNKRNEWKGKIRKMYEYLHGGHLIDTSHYEVFLLLYVATHKAVNHIEYWSERFTSEFGYKPLQLKVLRLIEHDVAVKTEPDTVLNSILMNSEYYDNNAYDKHFEVGGTDNARLGFAGCALPVVLSHNTPNNSIYILWGYDWCKFAGLFPRVSRHREF